MEFSVAQYESVIDSLSSGLGELSNKLQQIEPTVRSAVDHWYITNPQAELIIWLGKKLLDLGSAILDKLQELVKGALAPVLMYQRAREWQDIRGHASTVSGQLKPEVLDPGRIWSGRAADAYLRQVPLQSAAATRIATVADKTSDALSTCANVSLAFYVAIGVILVKFISTMISALVALGSAIFSLAGAALIVEESGVNSGLIVAAVSALSASLGMQATKMVTLHGEAVDNGSFPGGHWPNATTSVFSDATVTDGDADWSLDGN